MESAAIILVLLAIFGVVVYVAIAGGSLHTIALDSTGRVYAWGNNSYGQLGNGITINKT